MKRRFMRSTTAALRGARATIAWCMVGTAEYHVGSQSANHAKTFSALNPGAQYTLPPACRVDRTHAISP